jgi:hypothetical protein
VDEAVARLAPGLGELAHHHGEHVAGWGQTEGELRENVVLALPVETQVLLVRFEDIYVVVACFQIYGEDKILGQAELRDESDRLVLELGDLQD